MIERAKEKIRIEAEENKNLNTKTLSMQIVDCITTGQRAEAVLCEDKTLKGCKAELDKFAKTIKQGNESSFGAMEAEKIIFEYFGFEETNVAGNKPKVVIDINDFL